MASLAVPKAPARTRRNLGGGVGPIGLGIASLWLSLIVLLPLAAVFTKSLEAGPVEFWDAITAPAAR
jgi:sulfate/thiosulfate transport system permease protein